MVISGLNSNGIFCADMGDLILSEVSSDVVIQFSVYYKGNLQSVWSERYFPDSSGVIKVRDLGKVAMDYFRPIPIHVNYDINDTNEFSNSVGIIGVVVDVDDSLLARFSQSFYYSTQRINLSNSEYNNFYSRFSKRLIHPEQYIPLAYNLDEQTLKLSIAFYNNNEEVEYIEINYPQEDNQSILQRIRNVSPKVVAQKVSDEYGDDIPVTNLIYYDASLFYRNKLIDLIHYELDHKYHKQVTHLIFYNHFGFPETLYLTGKDEKAANFEGTYALISNDYVKVDTELHETHTLNSGYISEAAYDSIKDLTKSKEVYRYNGTTMERITITDIDLKYDKPKSSPLNVKITYRLANDDNALFVRPGIIDNKVFDKSFDNTFA